MRLDIRNMDRKYCAQFDVTLNGVKQTQCIVADSDKERKMTTTQNLIYQLRKRAITTLTLSQAADALEALQADVVRLNMALHGYQVAIETTEESLKDRVAPAMEVERLKAAGAVDCGHRPPCTECSDYAAPIPQPPAPSDAAFVKACRDELAKRKPEPAAETVGGLAKAVKAARGGGAPPAPMRRFA